MRRARMWLIVVTNLVVCVPRAQSGDFGLQYVSPKNGAKWIQPQTTIILRFGKDVDEVTLSAISVSVRGTASGVKEGKLLVADDNRTVIFKPQSPFVPGETVTTIITPGLFGQADWDTALAITFTIAESIGQPDPLASIRRELLEDNPSWPRESVPPRRVSSAVTDTLPLDFPYLNLDALGKPSEGRIFASNFGGPSPGTSYLMILDNSGWPLYYRKNERRGYDFKIQPNGLLTYYDDALGCFLAMNNFYVVVDTFRCGHGYTTDLHELQLLPNGHALLMSYDIQTVDMSTIVPRGKQNAQVTGLVIQELNRSKQVVFEWRSWDHIEIQDASHQDLTGESIDYVHGNAIELDSDGNLLISSRHLDEITKIDRATGEILWRWGGKKNEFMFLNDPRGFSHQHDIRRLPNGNVTLFDNGNYHTPQFSRAVEYRLDEVNKTAELVWEYRNVPDIYAFAMGNVQRLPNGNTLIGWGTGSAVTEVGSDGSKVVELRFAPGVYSYRAFRFDWQPDVLVDPVTVPGQYILLPNYPNPFNAITHIQVHLPVEGYASLKVYDALGREVAGLFQGVHRPGIYRARFDGSSLPSGIYFAHFVSEVFVQTKKMILLK